MRCLFVNAVVERVVIFPSSCDVGRGPCLVEKGFVTGNYVRNIIWGYVASMIRGWGGG